MSRITASQVPSSVIKHGTWTSFINDFFNGIIIIHKYHFFYIYPAKLRFDLSCLAFIKWAGSRRKSGAGEREVKLKPGTGAPAVTRCHKQLLVMHQPWPRAKIHHVSVLSARLKHRSFEFFANFASSGYQRLRLCLRRWSACRVKTWISRTPSCSVPPAILQAPGARNGNIGKPWKTNAAQSPFKVGGNQQAHLCWNSCGWVCDHETKAMDDIGCTNSTWWAASTSEKATKCTMPHDHKSNSNFQLLFVDTQLCLCAKLHATQLDTCTGLWLVKLRFFLSKPDPDSPSACWLKHVKTIPKHIVVILHGDLERR